MDETSRVVLELEERTIRNGAVVGLFVETIRGEGVGDARPFGFDEVVADGIIEALCLICRQNCVFPCRFSLEIYPSLDPFHSCSTGEGKENEEEKSFLQDRSTSCYFSSTKCRQCEGLRVERGQKRLDMP